MNGRIAKDGKPLKPGYDVKVGDVIELHYARKFLTVRILHVPIKVTPALKLVTMYEVISEKRDDPADWLG